MKFNCGLTKQEKMQRNEQRMLEHWRHKTSWHPWFAWYPVQIASGDCRWFETVNCKLYRSEDWVYYGKYKWTYEAIDS